MLTIVTYVYRDASNYKFRGNFVVSGPLTICDMHQHMFDHGWFIPQAVGLPSLVPEQPNEDDHLLHEIEAIDLVGHGLAFCTAEEFVQRLAMQNERGWFDWCVSGGQSRNL